MVEETEGSKRIRAYCSYSALTYTKITVAGPPALPVQRSLVLANSNPAILDSSLAREIRVNDPYNMQFNFPSSAFMAFRVPFSGLYTVSASIITSFDYELVRAPPGVALLQIIKRSVTDVGYGSQGVGQGTSLIQTPVSSFGAPEDGFGWTTSTPATNSITITVDLTAGDELYPELYLQRYDSFGVEAIFKNLTFSISEVARYIDRSTS